MLRDIGFGVSGSSVSSGPDELSIFMVLVVSGFGLVCFWACEGLRFFCF